MSYNEIGRIYTVFWFWYFVILTRFYPPLCKDDKLFLLKNVSLKKNHIIINIILLIIIIIIIERIYINYRANKETNMPSKFRLLCFCCINGLACLLRTKS
jgi:hypothetical protein